MQEVVLNAEVRERTGKHAKYARADGMVPGVYYSRGEANLTIQVPQVDLDALVFTSETHIIELKIANGESKRCIIRDVQFDPISDKPIHVDLQGLKENEKLMVEVPVVLTGGVPKGVKDGGMLQHFVHKIKVSCLPKHMPEKIDISVAELAINDFIHVKDLRIPDVTFLDQAELAIVGVMPPHIVKEAEPAAVTEELKEPEVVGKGKKVEEGEEAAEGEKKGEKKAEKKEEKKEEKKDEKKKDEKK
jgi:large subunit ribosomal protein L25